MDVLEAEWGLPDNNNPDSPERDPDSSSDGLQERIFQETNRPAKEKYPSSRITSNLRKFPLRNSIVTTFNSPPKWK